MSARRVSWRKIVSSDCLLMEIPARPLPCLLSFCVSRFTSHVHLRRASLWPVRRAVFSCYGLGHVLAVTADDGFDFAVFDVPVVLRGIIKDGAIAKLVIC